MNQKELKELLVSIETPTPVSISVRACANMRKKVHGIDHPNPFWNDVEKRAEVDGVIGIVYIDDVNKKLRGEGKDPLPVRPRVWGVRVKGSSVIEHKGVDYLEVEVEGETVLYFNKKNDTQILWKEIEPWLRDRDETLTLRTYKLSEIRSLETLQKFYKIE